MFMVLFLLKMLISSALGLFRGGEILPTGSTVLTRTIWAGAMSLLTFISYPFHMDLYEFGALWLGLEVMMYIPHAFAQNGTTKNMWEMAGVGAARGVVIFLALAYWHFKLIVMIKCILGMALIQSMSYVIGYYFETAEVQFLDGPTKIAEFVWGMELIVLLSLAVA